MTLYNKRRHIRTPVSIGVLPPGRMTLFTPFHLGPIEVEIRDLSAGGMNVISPRVFPLFFEFALEFHLPHTDIIQASGKAVRQVHLTESYEIGVSFTKIDKEVQESLIHMAEDYQACEARIAKKVRAVCKPDCRFLNLCQKLERSF